jgi:hypothetical protein
VINDRPPMHTDRHRFSHDRLSYLYALQRNTPSRHFSALQAVQICAPRQNFHSPPPSLSRWRP